MSGLIHTLWNYVNDPNSFFYVYHNRFKDENNHLQKFLFATMDEIRLRHAASFAKIALKTIDYEDADHFRIGLLRREVTG